MKRAAIVVLCLTLTAAVTPVQAQESQAPSNQERAKQDYLFQFANYADARDEYVTAKEAYVKYGTIASQNDAIAKAKQVLSLRAEVLRTHLQLLKVTLHGQQELDGTLRNAQIGKIEATQAFLETHKTNIERISSVFEVNAESERLQREAKAIEDLAYESLSFILIGQTQGLETRTRQLLEESVRQGAGEDGAIEQGASEVRRKLTAVRVAIDRATDAVVNIKTRKVGQMASVYTGVKRQIGLAKIPLQEAAQLVKEMASSLSRT